MMSTHRSARPQAGSRNLTFSVSYDYLCPFARNANEHVLDGLAAGAPWEVTFVPFSLSQVHVGEDEQDVWDGDDPDVEPGILGLQAGLAVRDRWPDRFPAVHRALFAARHDRGEDIGDLAVVQGALERAGVDADEALAVVRSGAALETLRKEHERAVAEHDMWGVPTFAAGDRAVFVRLMHRPQDGAQAVRTVERVLDLVTGFEDLNEFKQTVVPR